MPFDPLVPYRAPFVPGLRPPGRFPAYPPWNPNWSPPGNLSRHDQPLLRYLPRLLQYVYSRQVNIRPAIRDFVAQSELIEENGSPHGIYGADLEQAYFTVCDAARNSLHGHEPDYQLHDLLTQELDQTRSRVMRSTQGGLGICRRRFMQIAEISRQTKSARLGQVLATFFLEHYRHIVEYERTAKLALWERAICNSHMSSHQKRVCQNCILKRNQSMLRDRSLSYRPSRSRYYVDDYVDSRIGDWHDRGRRWDDCPLDTPRSCTSSPERRLLEPGLRRIGSDGSLIRRPSSAPGVREVARQANKVMNYAADLHDEARRLKIMTV